MPALRLSRETLSELSDEDLSSVDGAAPERATAFCPTGSMSVLVCVTVRQCVTGTCTDGHR